MAKSLRTANIRVFDSNNTKNNGVVTYTKASVLDILQNWEKSSTGIEYWFAEHKADAEIDRVHYHVVMRFKSPQPFTAILAKFPASDIAPSRNIKNSVQYLIHMNDSEKEQLEWSDVLHNCKNMNKYKTTSAPKDEEVLLGVLDRIASGEIREYNLTTEVSINIYAKYRNRLKNGLEYYKEKVTMDKNRNLQVIFFTGDTGTGKTTFAKQFCDTMKKSYCVSSSSNDPMQDYKGEDVLILDDMRDDSFTLTDLLKVTDMHTSSSVKSRYNNKHFLGELIIITSYKPLLDWYSNIDDRSRLKQLYRRIEAVYTFTEDWITIDSYDEVANQYKFMAKSPNLIVMKFEAKKQKSLEIFKSMGMEFSDDMLDKFDKITEADYKQLNLEGDIKND